jgi:hypothetical protein
MLICQSGHNGSEIRFSSFSGWWLSHQGWGIGVETICGHLREIYGSMLARTGEDNDGQKMNEVLTFLE